MAVNGEGLLVFLDERHVQGNAFVAEIEDLAPCLGARRRIVGALDREAEVGTRTAPDDAASGRCANGKTTASPMCVLVLFSAQQAVVPPLERYARGHSRE